MPDPLVPDDVEDPEATGVGDEPGRQVVAVGLVGAGRAGVDERLRVGREVAGATLPVLAAALAAPALRVVREAGLAGLVVGVEQARRDHAAGAGRVLDRGALRGERAVRVARGRVGRRLAAARPGDRAAAAGLAQRRVGVLALGVHDGQLLLLQLELVGQRGLLVGQLLAGRVQVVQVAVV